MSTTSSEFFATAFAASAISSVLFIIDVSESSIVFDVFPTTAAISSDCFVTLNSSSKSPKARVAEDTLGTLTVISLTVSNCCDTSVKYLFTEFNSSIPNFCLPNLVACFSIYFGVSGSDTSNSDADFLIEDTIAS